MRIPWKRRSIGNGTNAPEDCVALLPWGNTIEDYLDTIGVSLDTFCREFTGSWIFGYVQALQAADIRAVLICISSRLRVPMRRIHVPTGAVIWIVPASWPYRALQRMLHNPYGRTIDQAFAPRWSRQYSLRPLLGILREMTPYLANPPLQLIRVLRREGCSAILCQEYEYPRFDSCVVIGQALRLPVFASFQGGNYQRGRLERLVRPWSLRRCAGLIIAPRDERARVRKRYGLPQRKIAAINNPLDIVGWQADDRATARAFLGLPTDTPIAVWHGRVSLHQKGLDVLVDAWLRVCAQRAGSDYILLLIGTGQDAAALAQLLTSCSVQRVHWVNSFLHDRAELRRYLSAADVYVFPSRHEGFAVAPLEAMAAGLPVVATDASGIPELLGSAQEAAGIVVPRDDSLQLAEALGALLADLPRARQLGMIARQRIERDFSLERVGAQLKATLYAGSKTPRGEHPHGV